MVSISCANDIPIREVTYLPIPPNIQMKISRAQFHLDTLEREVKQWVDTKPYTVSLYDDPIQQVHVCRINMKRPGPDGIPMALGDFVSCLRAALDQLAWALAHTDITRIFTGKDERDIGFLISKVRDARHSQRLALFPSEVAEVIDSFQPYNRGESYRNDPLWQLNEMWTLDKHRDIPINCSSLQVLVRPAPPYVGTRNFGDAKELLFPLGTRLCSPMELEPQITFEILFGKPLGTFEASLPRLNQIHGFVCNEVIPRFARFFP